MENSAPITNDPQHTPAFWWDFEYVSDTNTIAAVVVACAHPDWPPIIARWLTPDGENASSAIGAAIKLIADLGAGRLSLQTVKTWQTGTPTG